MYNQWISGNGLAAEKTLLTSWSLHAFFSMMLKIQQEPRP
jgi:hypothetical protein